MRALITWHGLPAYAAACLRQAKVEANEHTLDVFGVLPTPARETVDEILGRSVRWIGSNADVGEILRRGPYDVAIVSGWREPTCRRVAAAVRQRAGSIAVMIDNRWIGSPRQLLRAAYQRVFAARFASAAWVPGKAARRAALAVGVPTAGIFDKLYGADPAVFQPGPPLESRPKRFLFVGQLIARKRVVRLANAFLEFAKTVPDWELVIIGAGPDEASIPSHPRIRVLPFAPPETIAAAMREARFVVLPSEEEHWGVVVHEASLSGCGLMLSSAVGAAEDLASPANCISLASGGFGKMLVALHEAANWGSDRLRAAERQSRIAAAEFGPRPFARSLLEILEYFQERTRCL